MNIERAQSINGWMSTIELTWLAMHAKDCEIIIEFGCFLGRSTRALADNSPDNCKIFAVDPWSDKFYRANGGLFTNLCEGDAFEVFKTNLFDHISTGKVIPFKNFSYKFPVHRDMSDLTFIDGEHSYHAVTTDIAIAIQITKKEGIICGHDYGAGGCDGVKKAVDAMLSKYEVKLVDTIWWTKAS